MAKKKPETYRMATAPNYLGYTKWKGENPAIVKVGETIEVTDKDLKNATLAGKLKKYFAAVVAIESEPITIIDGKKVNQTIKED